MSKSFPAFTSIVHPHKLQAESEKAAELEEIRRKAEEAQLAIAEAEAKAREADLRAQKEATEALARQVFAAPGEGTGSVGSGPKQPRSGSESGASMAAVAKRRRGA